MESYKPGHPTIITPPKESIKIRMFFDSKMELFCRVFGVPVRHGIWSKVHGGPTGMVVANMAVHGPFFQPANVEGTGSHHSWLWGEQSVHAYITTCGPKASLDTGIPPSLSTWPKETQRLLWNKEGLPDTPHNQRCLRMLAWLDMYGGPGNATPIIAIFNIQHWNNIDSGGLGVLTAQHLVCIG